MLPEKPDRRKTYWKVTNEDECHYGLQYKTGLIIDPKPFNNDPNESCVEGGIYFTTKEFIHRFFWIGTNLRHPNNDKYRADKVILGEKKDLNYYFDHLFDKKTFPIDEYKYLIKHCNKYFNKWFDIEMYFLKNIMTI